MMMVDAEVIEYKRESEESTKNADHMKISFFQRKGIRTAFAKVTLDN